MKIMKMYYWIRMKLAFSAWLWNGHNTVLILTETKEQKEKRSWEAIHDARYYWGKLYE